jgi:hypothetical protein
MNGGSERLPSEGSEHCSGRPPQERPFLILVVGYPAASATLPAITKRPLEDIATFI